jgi:hypothetical protein
LAGRATRGQTLASRSLAASREYKPGVTGVSRLRDEAGVSMSGHQAFVPTVVRVSVGMGRFANSFLSR